MFLSIFLLSAVYFIGLIMTHEASTNTWNFKWPVDAVKKFLNAITKKNIK